MNIKRILRIMMLIFVCFFITACNEEGADVSLSHETADFTKQKVDEQENVTNKMQRDRIVVYVNGAVKKPGVYTLQSGDRVYQAIDKAGGMTSQAKKDALNLAETVSDAQNIYIMTKKEYKKSHTNKDDFSDKHEKMIDENLININTADTERLATLPGIGGAKAAAIVSYREENGLFSSKEDIKNVSGIGDATYTNIKDLITIE